MSLDLQYDARMCIAMIVKMPGATECCQVVSGSTLVDHMEVDERWDDNDEDIDDEVQLPSLSKTSMDFPLQSRTFMEKICSRIECTKSE